MIDFMMVSTRSPKKGIIEIYPKFIIKNPSSDLMIRGGDFYAIWVEERGLWSTDEQDALRLIDRELDRYADENREKFDGVVKVQHMWDAETGMIDTWHKYCQKQMRDQFHMLDEKLIFANTNTGKNDYASKILPYPLLEGDCSGYERLISTLYSEDERHKIEWAIGAIVCGESKQLQKFMVLYGAAGTGKSTILNIIQLLFEGYYSVFDAKALGSSSNAFALEAFKCNPLVAIQHDGDLSHIEDNTRLNSLVSHELMTVNEKFKSAYTNRFKCFLFMGTNKPVKITDAKSGLIRRLIDVSPSGDKIPAKEYHSIMKAIPFELGAIAYHCREVYLDDPEYYDDYIPIAMMGASNDFYNFVGDSYFVFKHDDCTTLKAAWEMYKTYCDEAKVPYPLAQRAFKEELKNYFRDYKERYTDADGNRVRNYYSGFRADRFEDQVDTLEEKHESREEQSESLADCIVFKEQPSVFDKMFSNAPAQYASERETPTQKWENVESTLDELDTSRLHYVKVPLNHIVIDFDIPGDDGTKSFERNLEAASKWPKTYAELSKSGAGIHLHYQYAGDPTKLSRIYEDHIEVKVFNGNSSLRRKLTKCNDEQIATISSGLPLKGDDKMVNFDSVRSERGLRTLIKRNLNKEIHPGTKPSIDFIYKILEDAKNAGLHYDVSDMYDSILSFAMNSTHQADYCIKVVNNMPFRSDEPSDNVKNDEAPIVFYDVEVFPNLFVVDWKMIGEKNPVVRMINPSPQDIERLLKFRLVGFNNRRYDNHMLYARLIGKSCSELYRISRRIVDGDRDCYFGEAYNLSYTDIYDFSAKKQSLKKWEIELGIHHQELGLPWDKPVPKELWDKVAEYCENDVIATEAVWNALKADFVAREILADLANGCVNDTTNSLTAKIIFGTNRTPQNVFNWRNMGETTKNCSVFYEDEYTMFDEYDRPIFPGYKYDHGKSTYRGEEVGEGGYVFAQPGMYVDVALLDIASMHPSSIIAEQLFGPEYTKRYQEIRDSRIAIKHKDFDKAKIMLNGMLAKYLDDPSVNMKDLAQALKIVINSVYGLTDAKFPNPFRDPRNVDNIVAKRGALFMVNLKHEVQKRGFTVAHIKTDSIKIPNATPEIISFVMEYGKKYGYNFEHEATYERMCLVNKAVYIARFETEAECIKRYGYSPKENSEHGWQWTATGTQFAVPYVFKSLFSKEDITFNDMCETKEVKSALYLDMNESLPDVTMAEKERTKLIAKCKKAGVVPETAPEWEKLDKQISAGHNYEFVGKVGQFCPMKTGAGGGLLTRETTNASTGAISYASATGANGYRWMESELVKRLDKANDIDRSYYDALVNDAVAVISDYGDFEWFVSDDRIPPLPLDEPLPWNETSAA